jgi:glycosyltransferase involved in cell wall biosynthesis
MKKRAALMLTPRLPWPQDDGGRIVMWQGLSAAAREWDVTLVSFCDMKDLRGPDPPEVRDLRVQVVRVPHRPPPTPRAAMAGLFGRWPYSLARYRSGSMNRAVRAAVVQTEPAFALASNLHMATYGDAIGPVPLVLREQNLEHVWMSRFARALGPTPAGLYARVQAARLKRAERRLVERAALTLAIQPEETASIRSLCPDARVETLPVGVDLSRVPRREPSEPPTLLLAGSLEWPPNVEGALAFLRRGWPRVRARAPGVGLRLAGKNPPLRLRREAEAAGVTVAANVPSMIEEFRRAAALVIPLWMGAGARVKAIEAMATGLPIASTAIGMEGLGAVPGEHYLEAETPEALGDAAAELLAEPERAARRSASAHALVAQRYSLEAVARLQSELCASVAR